MREDLYPEPVSGTEAEGLPGTADDDSTAYDDVDTGRSADGPRPAALPADRPQAVDRFGTTPEEQLRGEPLDDRLAQEVPDPTLEVPDPAAPDPEPRVGRPEDRAEPGEPLTDLDEPAGGETLDESLDDRASAQAALADEAAAGNPDPALDSPVSLYDREDLGSERVGRLVAPDEGAHADREATEVAADAGSAGGGASAEEAAMHPTQDPPL